MYTAAALLESYERQIQSIEGRLREADENIDTVREVGHPGVVHMKQRYTLNPDIQTIEGRLREADQNIDTFREVGGLTRV